MKRTVLPLLALLSLVLVGCGGSDSSSNGDSRFAGAYDVILTREGSELQIAGQLTVDADGDVNGTFAGEDFGSAELNGEVSDSGEFVGTTTQDGETSDAEGNFQLDANTNLTGTIRQEDGGVVFETMLAGTRR